MVTYMREKFLMEFFKDKVVIDLRMENVIQVNLETINKKEKLK